MARSATFAILAILMSCVAAQATNPDIKIAVFTADWCQPCQQMAPFLDRLQRDGWAIQRINVDHEPHLVKRFTVQSLPTSIIFRGSEEVDRIVGALGYEALRKRYETAAGAPTPSISAPQLAAQPNTNSANPNWNAPQSLPSQGNVTSPQATVRGQSPASLGAFPLLPANAPSSLALAAAEMRRSAPTSPTAPVDGFASPSIESPASRPDANSYPATHSNTNTTPVSAPSPSPSRPSVSPQQAAQIAADATVRIRIEEANTIAFGTGTVIHARGNEVLVLTCGHMFRDMKPSAKLTIDLFRNGQPVTVPAQVIDFQAKELDVGLISFQAPFAITPVRIAPIQEPLRIGDVAFSYGCDKGADPTRRDTRIKHINRYLGAPNVEIEGAPVVGRSGGGLFDSQGRLIGVCNAADEEDNEGIYASQGVVLAQLKRMGMEYLIDTVASPPSGAEIATAAPNQAPATLASAPLTSMASATTSAAPNTIPNSSPAGNQRWPDENAGIASSAIPSDAPMSYAAPGMSPQANGQQLICVLRDARGGERIIEIARPTPELLQAIENHGVTERSSNSANRSVSPAMSVGFNR